MAKIKKLTQPLKFHNGKHYHAEHIVDLMPAHTHYVEAFLDGGSVLLRRDPEDVSEVANDLDTRLTNFWRVLQSEQIFSEFKRKTDAVPVIPNRVGRRWQSLLSSARYRC